MKREGNLRPLNKYRQAKTPEAYLDQRSKQMENGCIEFTGGKDKDGYGQCHYAATAKELGVTRAHQMAYRVYKGVIPDGYFVCHRCDNPSCINPDHLFVGTVQDNVDDMMRKGRGKFPGPKNPARTVGPRRVSKEQYKEIMELKGHKRAEDVAAGFGIHWSTVFAYWRGERAPVEL